MTEIKKKNFKNNTENELLKNPNNIWKYKNKVLGTEAKSVTLSNDSGFHSDPRVVGEMFSPYFSNLKCISV